MIAPRNRLIILSAVIVFELIGPLSVRWTIIRSGEARPETDQSLSAMSTPSVPSS